VGARPCWVGLEGQNFAASILDTQDLSTIRGGSLLMRDLVEDAEKALQTRFPGQVTAATKGGSFGVWRVDAEPTAVQSALPRLRKELEAKEKRHIAFGVVAVVDDGGGYARQRLRLRAALQRARLAETRLPYPALKDVEKGKNGGVCPIDLVRPIAEGTEHKISQTEPRYTSRSVFDRRAHGLNKKQTLLAAETLPDTLSSAAKEALARKGRPFAMQIGSISERRAYCDKLKSNLQDKICLIVLDGNGFGKVQDAALKVSDSINTQKLFDETLTEMRRTLASDVFNQIIDLGCEGPPTEEEGLVRDELRDPIGPDGPVIRFELLLWGGDEIMFIVPGRVGWQVMEQIAKTVAGFTFDAASLGLRADAFEARKVTFSVGAVFCHHDAPIARVKALADDLCGYIKGLKREGDDGRDGKADTLFMVEVLESFDHVGMDLGGHLKKRTPKWPGDPFSAPTKAAMRVMDRKEIEGLRKVAATLAEGSGGALSRGRLRQTAFALHRGAAPGAEFAGDKWADYVRKSASLIKGEARQVAEEVFGVPQPDTSAMKEGTHAALGQARLFTLLEEYWDYLTPEKVEEPVA
jgi:hypothetical protein